jgi:hypothetical protein
LEDEADGDDEEGDKLEVDTGVGDDGEGEIVDEPNTTGWSKNSSRLNF